MERIKLYLEHIIQQISYTEITWMGVIEILIIAIFAYRLVLWVKNTKAWMLFRGIVIIVIFILMALLFQMTTILYIAEVSINVLALTAVVVFQPEIRRALENLGQKNFLGAITPFEKKKDNYRFSYETVESIVKACESMSKVKTGALIVVEKTVKLSEFEETGIELDCIVSNQVLINIFEHNTPLHDGAIIVRGNRIMAATCYLPLSDNMSLSKELGTRHRAAVGMSEVSDAVVIAVSEETGNISVAEQGDLKSGISSYELSEILMSLRVINTEANINIVPSFVKNPFKGGKENEKENPS